MNYIATAAQLFAAAIFAVCLLAAARFIWLAVRRFRRRPYGVRRHALNQVDLPDHPPRFWEPSTKNQESKTAPTKPAPEGYAHVYVWSGAAGGYHFLGTRPIRDIELGTPPMQHVNQLPHPLVADHVDA